MKKTYYITTPIYYPSAEFHIGHCYTTIIADAIARYKRLKGYDVFFQTGTDEHSKKIENKAASVNLSPKAYVDDIVVKTKQLWKDLDIYYDKFIRTTDEDHKKVVSKIFDKLYEQGDIYKGKYSGSYCTPCESFWTQTQLIDGKCPDCNREVSIVEEETYFFKLSKYQDRLIKHLDEHPDFIQPISRKNEMINNFIKPGLEDLCVTRTSFKWGVPVSFDPEHIIYVWLDALTNYITSLGYESDDDSKFKLYWPADLHLMAKEIVRFHVIIWPIVLMALGLELPKKVFAHGWLTVDGKKISKSLNNYKNPTEYIDKYGIDAVRYFILKEVPLGNDGNFSEKALITKTNADLANNLGNLINRTISMVYKYFDGIVPTPNDYLEIDQNLIDAALNLPQKVDKKINALKLGDAIDEINDLIRKSNKYIDETTPWILGREGDTARLKTVLYTLLESIRFAAVMYQPFLPRTATKIFEQLNIKENAIESLVEFGGFKTGIQLNKPVPLFVRIEENELDNI